MAQQPILDGLAKIRLPDLHRSSTPRHLLGFLDHGFVNIDCTALPGISEGRALGIGIKAVQKDVNEATTVRQKDLVIKGWPALDIEIIGAQQKRWARLIDIDGTLITVLVTCGTGESAIAPGKVKALFDSLEPARTGPRKPSELGPLWSPFGTTNYTCLHLRDAFETSLSGFSSTVDCAVSIYADRIFMSGSWPIQTAVDTEARLADLGKQLATWAGTASSFPSAGPTISFAEPPTVKTYWLVPRRQLSRETCGRDRGCVWWPSQSGRPSISDATRGRNRCSNPNPWFAGSPASK